VLLRDVRLVPVDRPAPAGAVDVRLDGDLVVEVGAGLVPARGEDVLDVAVAG